MPLLELKSWRDSPNPLFHHASNGISNQLGAINLNSEDSDENWAVFQNVVHSSAATILGHPSCKHQDWFDENDEEIESLLKKIPLAQDTPR